MRKRKFGTDKHYLGLRGMSGFLVNNTDTDTHKPFQDLLPKHAGVRARWEYPFAASSENITLMLIQMLDLKAVKPRTRLGATFLKFLAENESAFDLLYCITFKLMDQKRLALQASYKDLKEVMKATRHQLKSELRETGIRKLEDLPSYNLLKR